MIKKPHILGIVGLMFALAPFASKVHAVSFSPEAASPARYDVVWNSPSKDQNGSMPLGNGSTGINAWIEPNGDLVFYISRTDSWDDNGRLLKIGRVRISLNPAPSTDDFVQTLSLADGTLKARCGKTDIRLWVDANHPVVHAEIHGPEETVATAAIELWRTEQVTIPSSWECSDVNLFRPRPGEPWPKSDPTVTEPDTLLRNQEGRIGWYHRNIKSAGPTMHSKIQGMDGFKRTDPLLHRTFGAVIQAENATRVDDTHLVSPKSKTHRFDIYVHTEHPATESEWLAALDQKIAATEATPLEKRRADHEAWWKAFWERSWLHAEDTDKKKDDAFVVSRGYALQRFINACGGRGAYPIKFNGSIFTVEGFEKGESRGPDFRKWGSGYWWQNTRLPYISMLTSGDVEMTDPLYKMYCQDLFDYHKHRAQRHTGHGGLYVPECMYFWGDMFAETYGKTPFEEREDKLQDNRYHKWEWVSGLELSFMMLDRFAHTQDEVFLKETTIPFATEVLKFFVEFYKVDEMGVLVMHPSQALETWWECTNPMDPVAGMNAVTERLLALPEHVSTPQLREYWAQVKAKLPPLPTREVDGEKIFAPAESFDMLKNSENPELYCVFPFRLCSFEKPNAEIGRRTMKHRLAGGNAGWRQDEIFMAYLGLADEARTNLVGRARNHHKESRFPAFWGPNFDWIPDQDHGGVLMKAFQSMILQTEGRKIFIAPAWPKDWNANFKLHAPYQTVVEGRVEDGKLVDLKVTPESRRADVVCLINQQP
jgi:alpha-L-fucosidase 2